MAQEDVVVIGGGISGLSFAFQAHKAGRQVRVLERAPRLGGCLHSERRGDYWFELGAHTTYNSYGGFLDLAVATGVDKTIVERGPARGKFGMLKDGAYKWLSPPKILLQLNWFEAALHGPVGLFRKKEGKTVREYYGGLVGPKNFEKVLSPFLAAVPSQSADEFPAEGAGSLFKKRPRREEFPRSYGFEGGLQSVCDAIARLPGITAETGVGVEALRQTADGFELRLSDGRTLTAAQVAIAVPPSVAANLLEEGLPKTAQILREIKTVTVDSMGVVLPREKAWMPECAFVVPIGDIVRSVVTRDPFPDPDEKRRAFAFHFTGGLPREQRVQRMSEILRVPVEELGELTEKQVVLPSPGPTHAEVVAALDQSLAGSKLALTGNYFAGLAIEDCISRSIAEWERVAPPATASAA